MLNPRQIEAFRAVVATGGVTAAAKALHLTQPAVTRLIRDFQQAVGLTLFTRRGVRLLPTTEALALHREVERQFVGLHQIARTARDLRERRAGALRVAALPAFSAGFLPRFAGRHMLARPGLHLALYGSTSPQISDWIASGYCELGYAQSPLDRPGLIAEMLPTAPAMAIVPAGHRLARCDSLAPADFAGESFVSIEQSTQLRYSIDAVFTEAGVALASRVETPLSMIACALVASGVGVSIVDPYTASDYDGRGVVALPFRPRIDFEIGALWSAERTRSALALDFAAAFREEVERFSADA